MIEAIPDDKRKSLESQIPMGRVGASQDVADTILFLASDLSSYVTGQIIGVDGGLIV
jgi:3-oxoacyl-[acyl-carrier protein] reductase